MKMSTLRIILAFLCGMIANHIMHIFLFQHRSDFRQDDHAMAKHLPPCTDPENQHFPTNIIAKQENRADMSSSISSSMSSLNQSAAPEFDQGAKRHKNVVEPRQSSRCWLDWNSADSRCKRLPVRPFDASASANLSCLKEFEGPPPVVAIATLPRSGGLVLRTALEYATGVKVAQSDHGQCNPRQAAFIETSFPFRSAKSASLKACVLWRNKKLRSKPKAAKLWGVIVLVRNPYRWLDGLYGADDIPESVR